MLHDASRGTSPAGAAAAAMAAMAATETVRRQRMMAVRHEEPAAQAR